MNVNRQKKCYIWNCGFNAFKYSKILQQEALGESGGTVTDNEDFSTSVPLLIEELDDSIKHCVITWSKIILQTDTEIVYASGHKVDKSMFSHSDLITSCGEDIVVVHRTGDLSVLKDDNDGCIKKCAKDLKLKNVKTINGTDKQCFILHNSSDVRYVDVHDMMTEPSSSPANLVKSVNIGIPVDQISCGKEHALFLTSDGDVYSLGGGSRGQLGHETLDNRDTPTVIETLHGIKMCSVAAGGWHSTCVSVDGDVYVWGWNESGQLGISCQTNYDRKSKIRCKSMLTKLSDNSKQTMSELAHEGSQYHGRIHSQSETWKLKINEALKQPSCSELALEDKSEIFIGAKNIENCGQINQSTSSHHHGHVLENTDKHLSESDCDQQNVLDHGIFVQDIEAVQIQTLPYALDLVDDIRIRKVSCGSRHTAILTESDALLMCGWNNYGQLCLGDTVTRDYLQIVEYFVQNKYNVIDVYCGQWNTVVVTNKT